MITLIIGMLIGGTLMVFVMKKEKELSYREVIVINDYLREEAKKWKLDTPYDAYIGDKQSELFGEIDGKTFHEVYCSRDILDIIRNSELMKQRAEEYARRSK